MIANLIKRGSSEFRVTTWTERANPKNIRLRGVAWSPTLGMFVVVGYNDGTDAYIVTNR